MVFHVEGFQQHQNAHQLATPLQRPSYVVGIKLQTHEWPFR
jgi:hypothetical protein